MSEIYVVCLLKCCLIVAAECWPCVHVYLYVQMRELSIICSVHVFSQRAYMHTGRDVCVWAYVRCREEEMVWQTLRRAVESLSAGSQFQGLWWNVKSNNARQTVCECVSLYSKYMWMCLCVCVWLLYALHRQYKSRSGAKKDSLLVRVELR